MSKFVQDQIHESNQRLMSANFPYCTPEHNVQHAAEMMAKHYCGELAVRKTPCQTLAIKRLNGRAELLNELRYLTTCVALPPLLLRTVMLCGLTGHVN
jgi:coenzyme F420-reducing hydrogenase beta subunit